MATILISSCPHDIPTTYGYHYLKRLAYRLADDNHHVIFLRSANLPNFARAILDHNPQLVILNGHGGSKAITGCNNYVILGVASYDPELGKKILRSNPDWMKGRIVFLFTCNTGKELAARVKEAGARAVAAYKRDYIFLTEDSKPATDMRAKPFFEAPIQLPLALSRHRSFGQACNAVRDAYHHYLEEAEAQGDTEQAKYLNYDLENFICLGNMGAKL